MESIKRGISSWCFNMLYSYYLPASSDIPMTKSSSCYFSVSEKSSKSKLENESILTRSQRSSVNHMCKVFR